MKMIVLAVLVVMLAGCGAAEETSAPVAVAAAPTATMVATATSLPTATAVPTSTPTDTATMTPSPTATATVTASPTATSSPTVDAAAGDLFGFQILMAGMTLATLNELENRAAVAAAGGEVLNAEVFGLALALGMVESELVTRSEGATGRLADYTAELQANNAAFGAVMGRLMRNEIGAADVAGELRAVRRASQRTFDEMLDELRRLGASDAQIEELMKQVEGISQPLQE